MTRSSQDHDHTASRARAEGGAPEPVMVERVAAALEAEHDKALCWQHMARAAITAMREPTQTMIAGGDRYRVHGKGSKLIFRGMIDAALQTEERG